MRSFCKANTQIDIGHIFTKAVKQPGNQVAQNRQQECQVWGLRHDNPCAAIPSALGPSPPPPPRLRSTRASSPTPAVPCLAEFVGHHRRAQFLPFGGVDGLPPLLEGWGLSLGQRPTSGVTGHRATQDALVNRMVDAALVAYDPLKPTFGTKSSHLFPCP